MSGGHLFGGCFGAPRALLLEVNGVDELCDPIGGEDYHLGLRLEWTGARLFYSRSMLLIKREERHATESGCPVRIDKRLEPSAYMAKPAEFGVGERTIDGNWDSSHLVLDILYGTRSTRSLGNNYDLRELSEADLPGLAVGLAREHWVDGQPLEAM
jgi:hypothetical protein